MQAQAVKQLGFFGGHGSGQFGQALGVGVFAVMRHAGHHLHHRHALQQHGHVFECGGGRHALQTQRINLIHHGGPIGVGQSPDELQHMAAVHAAQHLAHTRFLQLAIAKGNGLVGQAERIAHRAASSTGQQAQGQGLGAQLLGRQHLGQVLKHGFGGHGPQVELQAAREHRHRHFLRIGRGQHELQIFRGLFQGLQHRVERGVGQHVHLVDHEDLEAPLHRLVNRLLQQALHLVHTPVRGGVQLGVIHKTSSVDVAASLAHATRLGGDATLPVCALAVERLGQNARHRGLAHAPGAGEQIGMVQALLHQGIGQGLNHVLLPHHFGEIAGAVFTREDKVRHGPILSG